MIGLARLLGALALAWACVSAAPAGVQDKRLMRAAWAPELSDYGLFLDTAAQRPAPGVTPYLLTQALFSDYALKQRFVYLPPGQAVTYQADETFAFPVGAVLIKTFAYPADFRRPDDNLQLLETRLLVHKPTGWEGATYLWNAAQTEAKLAIAGADFPASFLDAAGAPRSVDWHAPNKNQCKGCHSVDGKITPIGPKARFLNRPGPDGVNQIAAWAASGRLTNAPAPDQAPRTPAPDDAASPLDTRARAYLEINCAHCHNPRGPANNSGLDLRSIQHAPALWGVGKRPVAAGRASAGLDFAIEPGKPDRSILVYRMTSTDPGEMMPELGRSLVHTEGLALVRQWIAEMGYNGGPAKSSESGR
jgi:uncharacterized repeat protein (TIGR03806 family)